jgi:AcrR family transcriptional regulator
MSSASGDPSTRDRILAAARRLVAERHPAALSVAQIAEAARVSHRTVYRYFPSKEALLEGVAVGPASPELAQVQRWDEARGALRVAWRLLAERLDEIRGERMLPGGLALRRIRLRDARKSGRAILRDAGVARGKSFDLLLEVVVLLTSSGTLLELMERHQHDVDKATDIVLFAVEHLVTSVKGEQSS